MQGERSGCGEPGDTRTKRNLHVSTSCQSEGLPRKAGASPEQGHAPAVPALQRLTPELHSKTLPQ